MKTIRNTSRRSFLAQVAGGGLAIGAMLAFGAERTGAQQRPQTRRMVVDSDPRDPARMPSPAPPPSPARTGNGRAAPPPAPSLAPTPSPSTTQRFIICPGNSRCPGNR